MKMVKVTKTLLVEDQEDGGAEALRKAFAEGHIDWDDLEGTATSQFLKFEDYKETK